ncbi:MAG: M16 family metallopeptidase [Chloroflexota bacterium]
MSATEAREKIETRQLDNGLRIIVRPVTDVPIGSFWVWYGVGSRNEVPGITGISHWTEHMLFKGTENLPAGEIFRRVSAAGGTLNGFTWIDYTTYFETLPIDQIQLALDIESDRMMNARFDPDEVESERTVILSERQGSENEPTFFLREEVVAASFRAHPYGQGVIGHVSDLRAITRDDLYQHYQTYYRPNNAVAVFAGDLDADVAFERIQDSFGALETGPEIPPVRTVEPDPVGEHRLVVRRPAPHEVVLMAFLVPQASHDDIPQLLVLDAVLSGGKPFSFSGAGGSMGRSSRMYRRFVSSGLAAGAGSGLALTIDPYLFSISATLNPETDREEFERVMDEELQRLREGPVGEEELERAKRQMRAQFAYAWESVTSSAYWLGSIAMVAPERDPSRFLDLIEAVTPADLQRVAGAYLTPERRTTGWLIPTDS